MGIITSGENKPGVYQPDIEIVTPRDMLAWSVLYHISNPIDVETSDWTTVRSAVLPHMDNATWVDEGKEIPEANAELAEITFHTRKIAMIQTVSTEMYGQHKQNAEGSRLREDLLEGFRLGLIHKVDNAIITDNDERSKGLANIDGKTKIEATPGNYDCVIDAVAELESLGAYKPDMRLTLSPKTWATMLKMKRAQGSAETLINPTAYTIPGSTGENRAQIHGIPIATSRFIPDGKAYLTDVRNIVSVATPIEFEESMHEAFSYDAVKIRAKTRIGWGVADPKRIAEITIN
ncbi:phage major capsid protein [Corynebacterium argentoratense]|uniref:Phage capsid-like C-terminal domain-containing protein n=1 Tax=Corynebacterium argentoratense DSM 44202 TaxID=1348662 RepID=U3GW86_9CORY|nr:phage major capsid protein [Corynebacterium argentoratense]AGU14221.1 hypothetical protein CARG_00060 [Corynebacterium argentoratense DSM 44202]